MARTLKVEIIGDASSLQRALGQATSGSTRLGSSLRTLGKVAAVGVGAAFVGLGLAVKRGFGELSEGQQVAAQTAAGLKSTGNAAKVTAKEITALAEAISRKTGIDDEAVQASENMLLTFTNLRNEAGKGNDIFNQATVAVSDMATRMNDGAIPSMEQLSQTSIRVGKALNDPVKGMGALSRVGVQFTDEQKKLITTMVKSGDVMGAQKLILAELTKEFGGSAKAAGDTLPGQLAKLSNAFDKVTEKLAVALLPHLVRFLSWIVDHMPQIEAVVETSIGAVAKAFDGIGKAIDTVEGPLRVFREWLEDNPQKAKILAGALLGLATALGIATVAQLALNAAVLLNPYVAAIAAIGLIVGALITLYITNDRVRKVFDKTFNDIRAVVEAVVPVITGIWQRFGDTFVAVGTAIFKTVTLGFRNMFDVLRGIINVFAGIFTGDWRRVWQGVKQIFDGMIGNLLGVIRSWVGALLTAGKQAGLALVEGIAAGVKGLVSELGDATVAFAPFAAAFRVASATVSAAWNVIQPIIEGVTQVIKGMVDFVTGILTGDWARAWDGMGQAVSGAVQAALAIIVGIPRLLLGALVAVGRAIITGIHDGITAAWPTLRGWFTALPGVILSLMANAGGWLLGKGKDLILGLLRGSLSAFQNVLAFYASIPGKVVDFFADAGKWLLGKGKDLILGLLSGGLSALQSVVAFYASIPGRVASFFADAGQWLLGSGKELIGGLLRGTFDKWQDVLSFYASLPAKIVSVFDSAGGWLLDRGKDLIGGLLSGALAGFQNVVAFYASLPGRITGFFADAGGWLLDKGKELIGGFLSGAVDKFQDVLAFYVSLSEKIIGVLASAGSWLLGKGKELIGGLLSGILAGWQSVVSFYASLPGRVISFMASAGQWLVEKGKELITGLLRGITDKWQDVARFFASLPGVVVGFAAAIGRAVVTGLLQGLATLASSAARGLAVIGTAIVGIASQAPGWAAAIGRAIVSGLLRGLANLASALAGKLAAIGPALSAVAGQAAGWAVGIGQAIVSGILSGVGGLFGALKSRLEGTLRSVLSSLNPFSSVESGGEKYIGKPIVEGAVKGVEDNAAKLATALAAKVKEAVENAKQAIGTARGDFASAFGELASTALQAFDAVVSNWVPPAQKRLDAMNLKQQIADLKASIVEGAVGIKDAQAALSAALAGGDPAAISSAQAAVLQAQKTHNEAVIAQEEFQLAQRAAKQQEAHDKKMARQRLHLQSELSEVQTWLAKHPGEYEKVQGKISALLQQHGVDAKFWGSAVGISLAAGLAATEGAVKQAAAAIAKAIAKYLKLKSPAEEGELSDLDRWFAPFADTLLKGLDIEAIRRVGADVAGTLKSGLDAGLQTLKTFTLGTGSVGLTLPPPDIVPTTDALATVAESTVAATVPVTTFRDLISSLPGITSGAFTAVAVLILKAVAPLAKALQEPREAIQAVADALHAIGRAAYATRAALQDTVDDIIRLLNRIGGAGGNIPGRARGGPVRAGSAYIVGETGPELFIPKQSGSIVASSSGGDLAPAGGDVVIHVHGSVLTEGELVRTVRQGLLKVDLYNPGSAIARS